MPKQTSQNERSKVYFDIISKEKSTYMCKIEGCDKLIIARNPYSFVSHIKNVHYKLYREEIDAQALEQKTILCKRLELIQHCAEIVTVNGRPFSYLLDSGFQNLVCENLNFLKKNKHGIDLKYPFTEIKQYIFTTAIKIQDHIKAEIKDRPVGVMIDIGSKNAWSVLSTCIQYAIDGHIKVRNIGMTRMNKRHKSEYIEQLLMEQFEKFGIEKLAIISFTTDNASNMQATVKLFDDDIAANAEESEDDEPDPHPDDINSISQNSTHDFNEIVQHDVNISEIRNLIQLHDNVDRDPDQEIDNDLAIILDDEASFRDAMASVAMNLTRTTININRVPCSAHTLQLAIKDALKNHDASVIISLCRLAAKLLRRETNIYDLRAVEIFIKIVRIDCEVRWNSTYIMVTSSNWKKEMVNLLSLMPQFIL